MVSWTAFLMPYGLGKPQMHTNVWLIEITVFTVAVAQLVEALRYKPEGRGFDSRWCHWSFSLTKSFRPHYGPGVNSVSYQK
jgi:hypothetical protein